MALLKAQFDAGKDYLEMFMPFVTEAIWFLDQQDFDIGQLREEISRRFGLSLPLDTLGTLLRRASKRDLIRREGGRYFRNNEVLQYPEIPAERKQVEREIHAVAIALQEFARSEGMQIRSRDDALAWLFAFLSDHHVQILLDDEVEQFELKTGVLDLRQSRVVARFIQERCLNDPALAQYMQHLVTGLVLQNTLFLKGLSSQSKQFQNLHVYGSSLRSVGRGGGAEKGESGKRTHFG